MIAGLAMIAAAALLDRGVYRGYHGSPRSFARFSRATRGGFGGAIGIWFASTREAARHFAQRRFAGEEPTIFVANLTIHHPLVLDGHAALVDEVNRRRKGGSVEDGYRALRRAAVRAGHDGIIVRNSDTDSGLVRDDYVVFDPVQIQIVARETP